MATTDQNSILIVGRGPSIYGFDWDSVRCPIMAVSSGIFAIPEGVHCDHFATLDEPKFFMAQLMAHAANAWSNDDQCRYWAFWADPSIHKHVVDGRVRTIVNRPLPAREVIEALEIHAKATHMHGRTLGKIKDEFYAVVGESYAHFGLQPGWGDYQRVRGWSVKPLSNPVWFGEGPLAKGRAFNSLLMAVQIASRLGCRTIKFAGVDLHGDEYASLRIIMARWHKHAARHGITWLNLSPESALSEFIPTTSPMELAA